MKNILRGLFTAVAVFMFSDVSQGAAGKGKVYPHSGNGNCEICHLPVAGKKINVYVAGSAKRALRDDPNRICTKCHTVDTEHVAGSLGVGKGHATGKKPEVNSKNLPLSNDGTINCATTCHNVHADPDDRQLNPKRLRLPVNSLCISCHDK